MQRDRAKQILMSAAALSAALWVGCPDEPMAPADAPPAGASAAGQVAVPPAADAPAAVEPSSAGPSEVAPPAGDAGAPPPPPPQTNGDGKKMEGMSLSAGKLRSEDEVKGAGAYVTLKGNAEGAPCKGKQVRLDATAAQKNGPMILVSKYIRVPGPFEFIVPKGEKDIWLSALCDVDGDGNIKEGKDIVSFFEGNPVKPSKDVEGVNFQLLKPQAGKQVKGAMPMMPPQGGTKPPNPGAGPGSSAPPADPAGDAKAAPAPSPAPGAKAGATPTPAPGAKPGVAATPAPGAKAGTAATPAPGAKPGATPTPAAKAGTGTGTGKTAR